MAGTFSLRSDASSITCRSPTKRAPTVAFFSWTTTVRPARARRVAAARPAGPAPAMAKGGETLTREGHYCGSDERASPGGRTAPSANPSIDPAAAPPPD